MKTYDYYLDEVAKEEGYLSFSPASMTNEEPLRLAREAGKRYAKQVAQHALDRAGMVVEITQSGSPMIIPADFITETEIITP